LEHLQSVAVRQVIVEDHQVHLPQAAIRFQCFPAVPGRLHLISQMLQKFLSQGANQRVIIYQQD